MYTSSHYSLPSSRGGRLKLLMILLISCLTAATILQIIGKFGINSLVLDPSIWQMVLLSITCFIGFTILSALLFGLIWTRLALPTHSIMVSHFKILTSWQQFVMYWASYALLFLGALLSLAAIF